MLTAGLRLPRETVRRLSGVSTEQQEPGYAVFALLISDVAMVEARMASLAGQASECRRETLNETVNGGGHRRGPAAEVSSEGGRPRLAAKGRWFGQPAIVVEDIHAALRPHTLQRIATSTGTGLARMRRKARFGRRHQEVLSKPDQAEMWRYSTSRQSPQVPTRQGATRVVDRGFATPLLQSRNSLARRRASSISAGHKAHRRGAAAASAGREPRLRKAIHPGERTAPI